MLVLMGLALGALGVGAWSYVRDRLTPMPAPSTAERPKSVAKPRTKPTAQPPEKDFAFYDMLPNFEVVIPEEDRDARPDKTPAPVEAPGVYVLQAGSYASNSEADRVRAQLALLGISSQIQRIAVDDRTYHRVRIGPIEDLSELNRVRQRLRNRNIDALLIRVGE
jgi:cell division protein FtsN